MAVRCGRYACSRPVSLAAGIARFVPTGILKDTRTQNNTLNNTIYLFLLPDGLLLDGWRMADGWCTDTCRQRVGRHTCQVPAVSAAAAKIITENPRRHHSVKRTL
jgi:hypothetical protein